MSTSTDAILVYGVDLGEEAELPWGDDDLDAWWRTVSGCPPGATYVDRIEWLAAHPCPVEEVRHCSDGCAMTILAVAGAEHRAWRGYPKAFERLPDAPDPAPLVAFAAQWNITLPRAPCWLLCSWWG